METLQKSIAVHQILADPEIILFFLWQVHAVVGVLSDDTDPMVTVMKLEKAPQETYADIGGRCNLVDLKSECFPLVCVSVYGDNLIFCGSV